MFFNESDWNETLATVQGLWPKWEPTDAQRESWRKALGSRDTTVVRFAIQKHFESSNFKAPRLSKILTIFHETVAATRNNDEAARIARDKKSAEEAEHDRQALADQQETIRFLSQRDSALLLRARDVVLCNAFMRPSDRDVQNRENNASDDPLDWSAMMRAFVRIVIEDGKVAA